MLKLDLRRVCYEREIGSPNEFLRNCGVPAYSATRLLNNQLNSLSFKYLEPICLKLNCTIDDLFTYMPNGTLPNNHPLKKLIRPKQKESVLSKLPGLSLEKLDQVRNFIDELEKQTNNNP